MTESSNKEIIITSGVNKAVVHAAPLKIDFFNDGNLVVSANARGLFKLEHLRTKPTA